MARHGYLREYDEEFERGEDPEPGWSELDRDWRDRDRERGLLFGERRMSHYGPERGGREQGDFGDYGGYSEGRRSFSADPDEPYRSWREKQLKALDRDYEDYCREREQKFHQDFDSWRRNRQRGHAGGSDELLLDRNVEGTTTDAQQEPEATESAATPGTTKTTTGRGRS